MVPILDSNDKTAINILLVVFWSTQVCLSAEDAGYDAVIGSQDMYYSCSRDCQLFFPKEAFNKHYCWFSCLVSDTAF